MIDRIIKLLAFIGVIINLFAYVCLFIPMWQIPVAVFTFELLFWLFTGKVCVVLLQEIAFKGELS